MAEVMEESTHVWSAKQRIAGFLSAMRHFAADLREQGMPVRYTRLDDDNNLGTLALELGQAIDLLQPVNLVLTAPGDWRVLQSLRAVAVRKQLLLDLRDDTHFYSTVREFSAHAQGRKPGEFDRPARLFNHHRIARTQQGAADHVQGMGSAHSGDDVLGRGVHIQGCQLLGQGVTQPRIAQGFTVPQ